MTSSPRPLLLAAGLLGFTGVALGAFGAHGLKDILEPAGKLETWKTAVFYQLLHAVALLALAGWSDPVARKIGWCWIVGVLLFSGSLYGLALGGPKILGPITPLGGTAFLAGWGWLVFRAWKRPAA
jgi:uncharacterized membrane protein YgdD (TMEM256/DUF423 family)